MLPTNGAAGALFYDAVPVPSTETSLHAVIDRSVEQLATSTEADMNHCRTDTGWSGRQKHCALTAALGRGWRMTRKYEEHVTEAERPSIRCSVQSERSADKWQLTRVRSNSVHDTFGTCPVRYTFRYTEHPIRYMSFSVQCPFRYTYCIWHTRFLSSRPKFLDSLRKSVMRRVRSYSVIERRQNAISNSDDCVLILLNSFKYLSCETREIIV